MSTKTWRSCSRFNCDCCGRFVSPGAPGTSWSRQWYYDLDGCPDLEDEEWRCAKCTDKHGVGSTNCAPTFPGNGRVPVGDKP